MKECLDKILERVSAKEYSAIKAPTDQEIVVDIPSLVALNGRVIWDSHRYNSALM